MPAAAEQCPDAELHDRCLQRIPETRQPACTAGAGHDVGLFYNPAKGADSAYATTVPQQTTARPIHAPRASGASAWEPFNC
jgi:hypothetical protein